MRREKTMIRAGERYINPLTDFGFKRIFGTPFNKDLLISFLNALLDGERKIKDVTFNNTEKFGGNEWERKAVFDVYCTTEDDSRIVVEMQNVYQDFYKDRSIYYSTFPIAEQAQRGEWNYELHDVYTVGILNFTFPEDKEADNAEGIYREVKLLDIRTKEVFYDKLTYIYVELANFKKTLEECSTLLDKWLFCLRHMQNLLERPAELQGRVFEKLFKTAEIAKFNTSELREYEVSMNAYREIKNGMESAERAGMRKGFAEGRLEGLKEVARRLKESGMSGQTIVSVTGLPFSDVESL